MSNAKRADNIIRVMGTDLDADKKIPMSLTAIKGVGYNLAMSITRVAKFDTNELLGKLKESDIEKLETIIKDPKSAGIPTWMLNRQKDLETGEDIHITGVDLPMQWRDDVNLLKKIRAYRGIRHESGLPTRGQRTRSSFRKGKKVGVVKKKR